MRRRCRRRRRDRVFLRCAGGSREPSYFARGQKRLDYVFWDYDSGKKRPDGIFGKPVVSADFGSDHRFVAAKIYVGDES